MQTIIQQTVTKEKLLASVSATDEMLAFLTACIRYGVSIILDISLTPFEFL